MKQLFRYQIEDAQWLSKRDRGCLFHEVGTGKSYVSLEAARLSGSEKLLVVCPKVMIPAWETMLLEWGFKDSTVINYDKLSRGTFVTPDGTDCLIGDEIHFCVEENTLLDTPIGLRKIKDVQVGDLVYSNYKGETRINPVLSKYVSDEPSEWLQLTTTDGRSLTLLGLHEVLTQRGWITANEIQISDYVSCVQESIRDQESIRFLKTADMLKEVSVYSQRRLFHVRDLWQRSTSQIPMLCEKATILFSSLFCYNQYCAYEQLQSYGQRDHTFKSECHIKADRTQTLHTRRQWQENAVSPEETSNTSTNRISRIQSADGISCIDSRLGETKNSSCLQDRLLNSGIKDRSRSRRRFPWFTSEKRAGQKERQSFAWVRVADIKIQKQRDTGESIPRFVDIEVDRDHNYLAAGMTVHNCKSWEAKRTIAFYKLASKIPKVFLLSATPMTRSAADLHPIMSFCRPGEIEDFYAWQNKHCHLKTLTVRGKTIRNYYGVKDTGVINALLKTIGIRRTKAEVLPELPSFLYSDIPVHVDHKLVSECLKISPSIVTEGLANGTVPAPLATLIRAIGLSKVSPAAEFITTFGDDTPVVAFFTHTDVGLGLRDALRKEGRRVEIIYGAVGSALRQQYIDAFQAGELDVILLQSQAAGVGITLTRSSHCVMVEPVWCAAVFTQMLGRLDRIGQQATCLNCYNIVGIGTTDQMVVASYKQKKQDLHEVMA